MTTSTTAIAIITCVCVAVAVVSIYRVISDTIAENRRCLRDTARRIVSCVLVLLYEEIAIDRYRRASSRRVLVVGPWTIRLSVPVGNEVVAIEVTANPGTAAASLAITAGPTRAGSVPAVVTDITSSESLCLYLATRRVLDAAAQEDTKTEGPHARTIDGNPAHVS